MVFLGCPFHKGDKVKITDEITDTILLNMIPNRPQIGEVYTVRSVVVFPQMGHRMGILLEEISNPLIPHPNQIAKFEPSFGISRFVHL